MAARRVVFRAARTGASAAKSRVANNPPITAPAPRARNTVPTAVALVPHWRAMSDKVEPSATSTMAQIPIELACSTPRMASARAAAAGSGPFSASS